MQFLTPFGQPACGAIMASGDGNKEQPGSDTRHVLKRRGVLRFGTLFTAFTGAAAISSLRLDDARAAPGDKNPPNAYVPTAEKGAASGVATLDTAARIPATQLPDLSRTFATVDGDGRQPVHKGELFVRAKDYDSFQAALDAGAAAKMDVVFADTFVLDSGIVWESSLHSIRGVGDARLDFRGMNSGTALTVVGLGTRNHVDWEFLSEIHSASGFQMLGPETEGTTVDGILVTTDTSKASHVNFDNLYIKGFRDGVILGNNTWCANFKQVLISRAKRRGISFVGTTNCGENYGFQGCTIANVTNSQRTGVGIYTQADCQFLGANFFATSLDYCDTLVEHNAGTLSFHGSHWENNASQPMAVLSYTAGKARTALNLDGTVVDPSEARPGRSHLIEVKPGSGSLVHVTGVGNTFRLYDRPVHVFRNMSSGSPTVRWIGGALDNNASTNVASFGHYTSQIANGDMEGALGFLPTFDEEGGWFRQGTVAYSFAKDECKSGTQSLKMEGTGVAASTGAGQTFRVQPRTILILSAYIKSALTSGRCQFRLTWKKGDKTTLGSPIFIATISATQDWTPYQSQYMVPVGAVFCGVSFVNVDLNGTVWVDEVVVTAV